MACFFAKLPLHAVYIEKGHYLTQKKSIFNDVLALDFYFGMNNMCVLDIGIQYFSCRKMIIIIISFYFIFPVLWPDHGGFNCRFFR